MGLGNTPTYWAIAAALGILLLLIYWDIQSRPKRWRWARIVALVTVVISLFALYINPYQTSKSTLKKVVWITNKASSEIIDSLKGNGFLIVENTDEYEEVKRTNGIEQLNVVGDGLEQWELDIIQHIDDFIPSSIVEEGIVDYLLGNAVEQSTLTVALQLNLSNPITIALSGSGIETLTEETEADHFKISLKVLPTLAGFLTYQIDGIREGDTLFSETIPIEVQEKRQSNVLMIANTPSFEFRGLKNHLAEAGFGIAERLKVSTDLYHQAFTNLAERRLANLSNRLLDDFQLLAIDANTYDDLSGAEQQRIVSRVEKGNLGLVLMGGKGANNLAMWQSRRVESLIFQGDNGEVKLTNSSWKLAGSGDDLRYEGNQIAQVMPYGLGQIVRPGFTDSYVLKLQAEKRLYALIWQTVLEDAIGKTERRSLIQTSDFPRVNEPTQLQLSTDELDELRIDSIRLALSQQWFAFNTWTSTYWPQKRGWQKVMIDEEEIARFFAFDSSDWTLQKRYKKQIQTAAFSGRKTKEKNDLNPIRTPISKWIFFGFFLAGMAFLWVEQRVR